MGSERPGAAALHTRDAWKIIIAWQLRILRNRGPRQAFFPHPAGLKTLCGEAG